MNFIFTVLKTSLISLSLMVVISPAYASGGGGFGGGGYGGGNSGSYKPRVVDETYEIGKALYKGRSTQYGKIRWCIETDSGKQRINSRHLKSYKTLSGLANALYDCRTDNNRPVNDFISPEDYRYILYYLIKRYRLKIDESA